MTGAFADKIELAKIPTNVKQAANKAMPRAQWTGATKSTDDGKVTYELEGEDAAKGLRLGRADTPTRKSTRWGPRSLSERSRKSSRRLLKKKFPRFKVETAYEARHEGKVIRYDFEGKRPRDKKEITVSVSADAKEIEIDTD